MRATLVAAVALAAAVCVSARAVNFEPTDADIKGFVTRNTHLLPDWVVANPTREVMRFVLSPATVDVTHPTGKVQTLVLNGADADRNDALRHLQEVIAAQEPKQQPKLPAPGTIDPSTLWNWAKDAFDFVTDNKAVVNATVDFAAAEPYGITSANWTVMSGWREWDSDLFTIEFKNGIGMKLTELKWNWYSNVGGSYLGTGQYLVNTGAAINDIYAIDTEKISATFKALSPVNVGTPTNPIAQLPQILTVKSSGLFKANSVQCAVNLNGDGTFKVADCAQN